MNAETRGTEVYICSLIMTRTTATNHFTALFQICRHPSSNEHDPNSPQQNPYIPTRVVSSEIASRKFPAIYSNLSRNYRKFVNYLCQSAISKSSIAKWCCKI